MRIKLAVFSILLLSQSNVYAEVGQLGIANKTTHNLSFSVNDICSKEIGDIKLYSIKSIPISNFDCFGMLECRINAYSQANCEGGLIGQVKMKISDHKTNISLLPTDSQKFEFSGGGSMYEFNIFIQEILDK